MNKIKNRTYLYSEMLNDLKNNYIDSIAILSNNKMLDQRKKWIYVIFPTLIENITIYESLFKQKYEYIFIGNFRRKIINGKEYINAVNIGKNYKLFIALKRNLDLKELRYVCCCIAISISDYVLINKIANIKFGIVELDIALDLGKEIYAIPGDIFDCKSYLANFAIKQGARPICSIYDVNNIP